MIRYDPRTGAALILNRKAASTSLQQALAGGCIALRGMPRGAYRVMFVRHPFARLASFYQGTYPRRWDIPFPAFVDWILETDAGNVHVDRQARRLPVEFLGRFEFLAIDFPVVARRFSYVRPLAHRNKGGARTWEQLFGELTDRQLRGLRAIYDEDLEALGYGGI